MLLELIPNIHSYAKVKFYFEYGSCIIKFTFFNRFRPTEH